MIKKAALGFAFCSACPLNKPLCELSPLIVFDLAGSYFRRTHAYTCTRISSSNFILFVIRVEYWFKRTNWQSRHVCVTSVARVRYAQYSTTITTSLSNVDLQE